SKVPEQIHLGFGIDKNFGKFAGITITSLVHNNLYNNLVVHIVYDELLPEDMEKLRQTEALYRNLTLHFYQITSTAGMTFIVPKGHITQAMYYRYLFADMLPKTVTRLIYLDADIICKGNILPLWQTDLQGRVLGAVRDWGEAKSCDRIGLKNGRYFNSGVLLLDLTKWRQQKLTQKLFKWLEQIGSTKILWGDQDALNGVIDGEFVELSKIFNGIVINNTNLNEDLQAVIVHYIDYIKP
ncbi:MAG: glycosyltransferase family 8 protein, partial [Phascolarctobacterium sp.]|uniref:glycosyltransferase family 8 protein n=1 Tax=Phascolarctobacterium sp. TaxID=2049039 RepID=UPI0025E42FBF